MFGPYGALVRVPGFLAPLLFGLSVALTLGMIGLGLLLAAQERSGSLGFAALVPAAFGLGNAVGLFVQGRLLDRFGQPRVLVPASLVCSAALLAAVAVPWPDEVTMPALAALAGAAFPATISSMRVLTTALVTDEHLRVSGYALLAVSFSIALVLGPLLLSGLVAVADGRRAVMVAALVIAAGGIGFAMTPASRRWHPGGGAATHTRTRGSRGWSAGLLCLFVSNSALGFAAGATSVAVPAATLRLGVPALAGVAFAAMAAGDLVGGLVYGAVRWRADRSTQLLVSAGAVATVALALVLASGYLPLLVAALAVSGAASACVSICNSALLDRVTGGRSLTSSYTTMVACGLVANSTGVAASGFVAEHAGPAAAFALAALGATTAATWLALRRRLLVVPA